MEFLADDILPERVDGLDIAGVTRERGDVCHAAVEIAGADGVALVSAIFSAEDIEAECKELKALTEQII